MSSPATSSQKRSATGHNQMAANGQGVLTVCLTQGDNPGRSYGYVHNLLICVDPLGLTGDHTTATHIMYVRVQDTRPYVGCEYARRSAIERVRGLLLGNDGRPCESLVESRE